MIYVAIQHNFNNITKKYQSNILVVKKRVPQGSILGPLFFNMYVEIITQFIPERNIAEYTEVTAILQL